MTPTQRPRTGPAFGRVRVLLWLLVALAVIGIARSCYLVRRTPEHVSARAIRVSLKPPSAGPFTLVDADGKPFSSQALEGKPYALYFGYTRCGDVCPTTLSRLVKLRNAAGGPDALNIVFITIDPANDGPKEVGQYATCSTRRSSA